MGRHAIWLSTACGISGLLPGSGFLLIHLPQARLPGIGNHPVTAGMLRFVESGIGGLEQIVDGLNALTGKTGDAKTCGHPHRFAVDRDILRSNFFPQALSNLRRHLDRCLGQKHREFFTAVAADLVLLARAREQKTRCLYQHGVTRVVTQRVVDLLEVIDVDHDTRNSRDGYPPRARKF